MEAKKKLKEPISRISHSRSGVGNMSFVDNRPQSINQAKVIDSIQKKEDSLLPIAKRGDGVGCILQRTINHVYNYGCEEHEAANQNFKTHMSEYIGDPIEFSRIRGAQYNTVISITDKQLAEEIAAELFTWPTEWQPYDKIDITTNGDYNSITYYDGKYVSIQSGRFRFKCQLVDRVDGTQYYEAYHLIYV